ncbi:MAG: protein-L-isoaspartate(D-aspartate) O-methyltransferase [Planctomycetota bacterium]
MRAFLAAALLLGCGRAAEPQRQPSGYEALREAMVRETIVARDVQDPRVLAAMRKVPRHEFVPAAERRHAYEDTPLPIGHGQTISQPFIVALMAENAEVGPGDRVLEIGTGSGYGAAVLAELAADVFTIEILEPLAVEAGKTLDRLGYKNVYVRSGDGYRGWPEEAPFDAIVVTAAPPEVPEPLKNQLKVGGKLVLPVGTRSQQLRVITRTPEGFVEESLTPVRFVPMTGEAQKGG